MNEILRDKKIMIFDLDGTLVSIPKQVLLQRVRKALKTGQLPKKSGKEILEFYKKHDWDKTLEEWGLNSDQTKTFWRYYIDYVENHEQNGTIVYKDTTSALSNLKKRGVKMSVLTSVPPKYLQRQIEKIGKDFFVYSMCVGHNCNNLPQKPSPKGIYHILDYIGSEIEDSVFIGDSYLDVETAKNAGCLDVLIDRGTGCLDLDVEDSPRLIKPTIKIKLLGELV